MFIYFNVEIQNPSKVSVSKCHFSMLQEIKGLREELSTRLNSSDTMEIIKEKEEQIRDLLEEGKTNLCSRLLFFTSTNPHSSTLDRLYSQENVKHEASQRLGLAQYRSCFYYIPTTQNIAQIAHKVLTEE